MPYPEEMHPMEKAERYIAPFVAAREAAFNNPDQPFVAPEVPDGWYGLTKPNDPNQPPAATNVAPPREHRVRTQPAGPDSELGGLTPPRSAELGGLTPPRSAEYADAEPCAAQPKKRKATKQQVRERKNSIRQL